MSFKLIDIMNMSDTELSTALDSYEKNYTNNINELHYYDSHINSKRKHSNTYFGDLNPNVYVEGFSNYVTLSDSIVRIADAFYDYFENKSLFLLKSIIINDDMYDYDVIISDKYIKISKMKEYGNYQLSPFKEEIFIENFSTITPSDYIIKLYSILVDLIFKRNSYLLTTFDIFIKDMKNRIKSENPLESDTIISSIMDMYTNTLIDFKDNKEYRLVFKIQEAHFDDTLSSENVSYYSNVEVVEKSIWDLNVLDGQDGYITTLNINDEAIDVMYVDFDVFYSRDLGDFTNTDITVTDTRPDTIVDVVYSVSILNNYEAIADVLSITTLNPPLSPSDGDTYIIPSNSVGDWYNKSNQLATYDANNTQWVYTTVPFGTSNGTTPLTKTIDTDIEYMFNGQEWIEKSTLDIVLIDNSLDTAIQSLVDNQFVFVPDRETDATIIYEMGYYYMSILLNTETNKYELDTTMNTVSSNIIKYIKIEQNKIIDR